MALRRFDIEAGGDSFSFKSETEEKIAFWRAKYPADRQRSAVIPMLWLAQKDNNGWLSEPAMREVADRLEIPYIRVYEVATFYTMFRLQPVGKFHIQLCGTTPCMLRGAEKLRDVCIEEIGPGMFVTDDKRLSWEEVECLGACVNAPMAQINDDYFEDLTPESFRNIIAKLKNGAEVHPGPQIDRINSGPEGGTTVLTEPHLFDGSRSTASVLPNLPGSLPTADGGGAKGLPAQAAPTNTKRETTEATPATKTTLLPKAPPAEAARDVPGERPEAVNIPVENRDDLKRIKGIGPSNEDALNALGICTFRQIAEWTPANIDWVEGNLSFPGRIEREQWVSQAKDLAAGRETDFSRRVDAGEVPSSQDDED
ncbi:NADH-quinone oxidoreductase subunit NuoE [Hyphomonas johnsonii]|uniref:NADH-quinone oxidoreductase subunit E n=1 Tax=Hyphomonas johnsonii MHS-2 TaxID=1280950 RepID=A0A059FV07_9PROT|nr:NADH-quinone oxidoreductase subunit NuoE [Hyphomonas johnsonii]KCZ94351.1 NADH-quinone oxidoreductase subunit E [Hyphomonas johnsonii MHS-2]